MLRKLFRLLRKFFFKDKLTDVIAPLAMVHEDLREHMEHHGYRAVRKDKKANLLAIAAHQHRCESDRAEEISTKLGTFLEKK